MRQIHHIDTLPRPNIVHEAAGTRRLRRSRILRLPPAFWGSRRESDAIAERLRALRSDQAFVDFEGAAELEGEEVTAATREVENRFANLGRAVEMALLSRLHWWTVEYGLIGTLENPKIYGAGLLSSIGESVSCLEPQVKKIWYSIDAQNQPSTSRRGNRSFSFAGISSISATCSRNSPAKWRIGSVEAKG